MFAMPTPMRKFIDFIKGLLEEPPFDEREPLETLILRRMKGDISRTIHQR